MVPHRRGGHVAERKAFCGFRDRRDVPPERRRLHVFVGVHMDAPAMHQRVQRVRLKPDTDSQFVRGASVLPGFHDGRPSAFARAVTTRPKKSLNFAAAWGTHGWVRSSSGV